MIQKMVFISFLSLSVSAGLFDVEFVFCHESVRAVCARVHRDLSNGRDYDGNTEVAAHFHNQMDQDYVEVLLSTQLRTSKKSLRRKVYADLYEKRIIVRQMAD